jgi:dienelactone hydrolase
VLLEDHTIFAMVDRELFEPVVQMAEDLQRISRPIGSPGEKGPVLGHFATRDQWITRPMVEGFERAMEAGKPLTVYWYEADHAFAS